MNLNKHICVLTKASLFIFISCVFVWRSFYRTRTQGVPSFETIVRLGKQRTVLHSSLERAEMREKNIDLGSTCMFTLKRRTPSD